MKPNPMADKLNAMKKAGQLKTAKGYKKPAKAKC